MYNPNPASEKATQQYIVAPLAAILALVCPAVDSADQGETYSYPLFCKIRSNGLFSLQNAGITSVQITKGGAEGLVAYNNRVGLIDVRIDFQNLYNTMVIGSSTSDRPVVKDYLETLMASQKVLPFPSGASNAGGTSGSAYEYKPLPSTPTTVAPPTEAVPRVNPVAVETQTSIIKQVEKGQDYGGSSIRADNAQNRKLITSDLGPQTQTTLAIKQQKDLGAGSIAGSNWKTPPSPVRQWR